LAKGEEKQRNDETAERRESGFPKKIVFQQNVFYFLGQQWNNIMFEIK
jgi:hypothetical protein